MLGRTPGSITAIRPMKDGVISDFDITQEMLRYFIRQTQSKFSVFRFKPRIVVAVPSGITQVERRAVKEAAESAGAREVFSSRNQWLLRLEQDCRLQKPVGA